MDFLSLPGFFIKEPTASIYPYETPVAEYLKNIEISETTSGLDFVDCIYVINLDSRPEKWVRMQDLFSEKGLKINQVAGINGWQTPYPIRL